MVHFLTWLLGLNVAVPDIATTNTRFGGLSQGQASWIIFSNGLQDPWGSNLGMAQGLFCIDEPH